MDIRCTKILFDLRVRNHIIAEVVPQLFTRHREVLRALTCDKDFDIVPIGNFIVCQSLDNNAGVSLSDQEGCFSKEMFRILPVLPENHRMNTPGNAFAGKVSIICRLEKSHTWASSELKSYLSHR